jgi:hypothetical protein
MINRGLRTTEPSTGRPTEVIRPFLRALETNLMWPAIGTVRSLLELS